MNNTLLGAGQKKEKHLTKPEVGHFRAQGVPLKRKLREFPVTEDALLPVGTTITVRHFVPEQFVDVTGITKGKGCNEKNMISVGCLRHMGHLSRIAVVALLVKEMLLEGYVI
ncbi:unnamed protein product [Miscanthus lutarioriparius]|uniref:Uncharacterized protein n=1 Tax=Miscanthus lutarioriparius TaxID=422564 RepID=A0A811PE39_9POAL|nr:unnamed protein product [Miscanthus lutarioriparius]